MTETDVQTPAVTAEAKSAAAEFLNNFNSFKDDMSKRMTDMTSRIEGLDRKATGLRRPALDTSANATLPHQKAFAAYVRRGDEDELKSLALVSNAGRRSPVALRSSPSMRVVMSVIRLLMSSWKLLKFFRNSAAADFASAVTAGVCRSVSVMLGLPSFEIGFGDWQRPAQAELSGDGLRPQPGPQPRPVP